MAAVRVVCALHPVRPLAPPVATLHAPPVATSHAPPVATLHAPQRIITLHAPLRLRPRRWAAGEEILADRIVVAPGHSARGLYTHLHALGARLEAKPFSVGFRVEHPQTLVDTARYGEDLAAQVQRGASKVPVADYRLAANVPAAAVAEVCTLLPCVLVLAC
jgi:hypothetical protein